MSVFADKGNKENTEAPNQHLAEGKAIDAYELFIKPTPEDAIYDASRRTFSCGWSLPIFQGWVKQPSPCCAAAALAGAYNAMTGLARADERAAQMPDGIFGLVKVVEPQFERKQRQLCARWRIESLAPIIALVEEELNKIGKSLGGFKNRPGTPQPAKKLSIKKMIKQLTREYGAPIVTPRDGERGRKNTNDHSDGGDKGGDKTEGGERDEFREMLSGIEAEAKAIQEEGEIDDVTKVFRKLYELAPESVRNPPVEEELEDGGSQGEAGEAKVEDGSSKMAGGDGDVSTSATPYPSRVGSGKVEGDEENIDDDEEEGDEENANVSAKSSGGVLVQLDDTPIAGGGKGKKRTTAWDVALADLVECLSKTGALMHLQHDRPSTTDIGNWALRPAMEHLWTHKAGG